MRNKKEKAHAYGMRAEKLAAWYLRCKCYRILAERYRNHGGEIDIVAKKGDTLIAIEVKARRTIAECEDSVPVWKRQKIARAVEGLLAGQSKIAGLTGRVPSNIRFDAIWIAPGHWPVHIQDAWRM